ncbi:MAG: ankyrin repeat domain-containing protein [Aquabacterium sp.]|nr:ankyrin repeat domain-containing protein [Aquabacterium sp.]
MNAYLFSRLGCAAVLLASSALCGAQGVLERTGPVKDLDFQDVGRDGPWQRSAQARLSQPEQQLLQWLTPGRWVDALALLKQQQPDLNRRDESGLTPLSMAARAGQLALVREMIRQGADVDQIGAGGATPLGAAALAGHELVVRDLLLQGARVDVPGASGQLPLHLACAAGHTRVVAMLVAQGADWRGLNLQGRHAVAEAAYFGQIPVLQWFDAAQVDLSSPDRYRLNAVHAAALGMQPQAVAWLRDKAVPVPSVITQVLIDQLASTP